MQLVCKLDILVKFNGKSMHERKHHIDATVTFPPAKDDENSNRDGLNEKVKPWSLAY